MIREHVFAPQPTIKDGKEYVYWNVVENRRCAGGKVVQRQVLYLGEINASQRQRGAASSRRSMKVGKVLRSWRCFPPIRSFPLSRSMAKESRG
jgi:hypothetical protein